MPLSIEAVVEAGVSVARMEGLSAVGVRAVAATLDVTPMAIYRYVASAAALEAEVVDHLLAKLPTVPDHGAWQDRCREWAHGARLVLGSAPGLSRHVLLRWIELPAVLICLDGLVDTLQHEGPRGVDAVAGANAVLMHVLMRAQAEEAVRTDGLRRDLSVLSARRAQLPTLWAHRDEYRIARLDEHFAYGLDALLTGLDRARRSR